MLRYIQNFRLKVSRGKVWQKKHAWSCLTTTPSTTVPMASSPPFDPPDPSLARLSDLLSRKQQVNNIIHQSCLLRQTAAAAHLSRTLPWGDEWQRWWCQYDLWGEDDKEEIRSSHHYHQVPPLTQFSLNFHNKRCWGRSYLGCSGGIKRRNKLR